MKIRAIAAAWGSILATVTNVAAQSSVSTRSVAPVLAISSEPLAAVSQVRELPGGRILVNDNSGRRLLLFDSTLKLLRVVADTTSATAHAYPATLGGLVAFRADSSLLVDPDGLFMLVLDPSGRIVRTMAVPQASEVNYLIGGPYGTPGLDSHERLVYKARVGGFVKVYGPRAPGQSAAPEIPDSAMVVRFDLATRVSDTVAKLLIPNVVQRVSRDENGYTTISRIVNPLPWVDDWALLSDGVIAVVRGRDYKVEFFAPDDQREPAIQIPFAWERLRDEDKSAILDSARIALALAQTSTGTAVPSNSQSDSASRRRRPLPTEGAPVVRGGGGVTRAAMMTSNIQLVSVDEMPDYRPPIRLAAALGDTDGNLWVRTTKLEDGGAVYDVIRPIIGLVVRFRVPPGRVIVGFGREGVVYMGVLDGKYARLERARVSVRP